MPSRSFGSGGARVVDSLLAEADAVERGADTYQRVGASSASNLTASQIAGGLTSAGIGGYGALVFFASALQRAGPDRIRNAFLSYTYNVFIPVVYTAEGAINFWEKLGALCQTLSSSQSWSEKQAAIAQECGDLRTFRFWVLVIPQLYFAVASAQLSANISGVLTADNPLTKENPLAWTGSGVAHTGIVACLAMQNLGVVAGKIDGAYEWFRMWSFLLVNRDQRTQVLNDYLAQSAKQGLLEAIAHLDCQNEQQANQLLQLAQSGQYELLFQHLIKLQKSLLPEQGRRVLEDRLADILMVSYVNSNIGNWFYTWILPIWESIPSFVIGVQLLFGGVAKNLSRFIFDIVLGLIKAVRACDLKKIALSLLSISAFSGTAYGASFTAVPSVESFATAFNGTVTPIEAAIFNENVIPAVAQINGRFAFSALGALLSALVALCRGGTQLTPDAFAKIAKILSKVEAQELKDLIGTAFLNIQQQEKDCLLLSQVTMLQSRDLPLLFVPHRRRVEDALIPIELRTFEVPSVGRAWKFVGFNLLQMAMTAATLAIVYSLEPDISFHLERVADFLVKLALKALSVGLINGIGEMLKERSFADGTVRLTGTFVEGALQGVSTTALVDCGIGMFAGPFGVPDGLVVPAEIASTVALVTMRNH